ncbi:hypothetical protein NDU88_000280 [Pleurodeles waltl]|uniref:Uncharacterized protein n=1 Tax=Pleurodeles waltl TaxID=8319 RepID=A0AAV7UQ27_PLEWA|nr:hypothetical protein NDU88_000280 [Pleurodeles waltl]
MADNPTDRDTGPGPIEACSRGTVKEILCLPQSTRVKNPDEEVHREKREERDAEADGEEHGRSVRVKNPEEEACREKREERDAEADGEKHGCVREGGPDMCEKTRSADCSTENTEQRLEESG